MGFSDDDTEILPALTDHGESSKVVQIPNRLGLAGDNVPKGAAAYGTYIHQNFAELEARIMAMFEPPFKVYPAIVVHDEVAYVGEGQEHSHWIIADTKLMPYEHAPAEIEREQVEAKAKQLTAAFLERSDLSK